MGPVVEICRFRAADPAVEGGEPAPFSLPGRAMRSPQIVTALPVSVEWGEARHHSLQSPGRSSISKDSKFFYQADRKVAVPTRILR